MPAGADAFLVAVANTVLSQYGALTGALAVAIYWLSSQLSAERKAHAETTERLFAMSEKQSEAANAVSQALNGIKSIVDRLAYDRRV